jgi:hypothetical protein
MEHGQKTIERRGAEEKNLSPGLPIHRDRLSPQGRGALPKGRILQIRTMVVAAEAELPLSPWRGGRGERQSPLTPEGGIGKCKGNKQ